MTTYTFPIAQPVVEEGCVAADTLVPIPPPVRAGDDVDVLVIGAGQAGLSAGYFLSQARLRFVIVDANQRVGDSWRARWDSLRLFTPGEFDGLAGLPYPGADRFRYPTKDEMGAYLERYAKEMRLPLAMNTRIELLQQSSGRYTARAAGRTFAADQVIVAMANYQRPRLPAFAAGLRENVFSLHSSAYRNPGQLRPGSVLVVGAGNSGAEIAAELASAGRETWLSGTHPGVVPFDHDGFLARHVISRILLRGVFHRLLTIRTPMGRAHRRKALHAGTPLISLKPRDLARLGVKRVGRTCGTEEGLPFLEDGTILSVDNVVWCTGFKPEFEWVDLPVFDDDGAPRQQAGIVPDCPGLYFVGLHYQYALSSAMVHGVGRDAKRVVDAVVARVKSLR